MTLPPTKKRSTPIPEPQVSPTPKVKTFDPSVIQSEIHKLLKLSTFEPEQRYWLDTGSPDLHAVLGSRKLGLPYGKLYELSGLEHGGKTTISLILAAMAQQDGAGVGYIDVENSRDELWSRKLGLDYGSVLPIYPKLVKPKPKKDDEEDGDEKKKQKKKKTPTIPYLQSAEDLFEEAEMAMYILSEKGYEKQFWIVDSIAMLQTEKVIFAGADQNMNTRLDRAKFLSELLPRWAGLAANYNASVFFVNQLRMKQGMVFGDPLYSPGGKALDHALSIRGRVKRGKRELHNGKVVGISGTIENRKNKAGGGSVEQCKCSFRILWNRAPAKVEFGPVASKE